MTKRKDPADLKIRARDDLTPKPRPKKSPKTIAKNVLALRATQPKSQSNAALAERNPDRPLTEKQLTFVRNWAQGETILTAAYRAGYADSGAMAYKMARDPAILQIYHAEKLKYEESCQMTRKRVMDGLLEGIEMAKLVSEPASMISGWREVGKMCGYYEPVKRSIDINISGNVTMKRLESATDDELLKLIKGEITDVAFREVEEENE
jgi:hypothetical protein